MARRKRKKRYSKSLLAGRIIGHVVLYAVLIFVLISLARTAYSFGFSVFTTKAMAVAPGRDVAVTIDAGMSSREIGKLLESKGLIRDSTVFAVQAKVYDYELLPGTYILNTSQTVTDMMQIMSTVPETETEQAEEEESRMIPTSGETTTAEEP